MGFEARHLGLNLGMSAFTLYKQASDITSHYKICCDPEVLQGLALLPNNDSSMSWLHHLHTFPLVSLSHGKMKLED